MISHQHIGMQGDVERVHRIAQQVQVVEPVLVVDEDGPAIHAALRDVHRDAGQLQARSTGHGTLL